MSSHGGMDKREVSSEKSKMIQAETAKCVGTYMQQQGNALSKTDLNQVHETQNKDTPFDGYNVFSIVSSMDKTVWVIDFGVSAHTCSDPELLQAFFKSKSVVE